MIIDNTDSSPGGEKSVEAVINNFSITVATVNGSGSQTSNLTLMRALFKMGIPVSGKNLFPSNIQGLPTWYTIRINEDIHLYPMPIKPMVRDSGAPSNIRDYIANMVYVGITANILGIDMDHIYQALEFHFKGKQKPIDLNWVMVKNAFDWAAKNLKKTDSYSVKPSNKTDGFIMADGNTAAAFGALYGGVEFAA